MKRDKSKVMNDLKEFIDDIPVELHLNFERTTKLVTLLNEILGFLACDEKKIKKLTEENAELKASNKILTHDKDNWEKAYYDLACEVEDLRAENERLKAEKETLEIYCKDFKYRLKELLKITSDLAKESEDLKAELFNCVNIKAETRADTVREFAERLKKCFNNEIEHLAIYTEEQVLFAIDQIAKEVLEGEG